MSGRDLGPLEAAFASIFGYRAIEPGEADAPAPADADPARSRQQDHAPIPAYGNRQGAEL